MHTGGAKVADIIPIIVPSNYVKLAPLQGSPLTLIGLTLQDIPKSIEISLRNGKLIYLFVYADTQTYTKHSVAGYDFLFLYIGKQDGILMGWEIDFNKAPKGYVDCKWSLLNSAGYRLICRVLKKLATKKQQTAGESLPYLHFMCSADIIRDHFL